jgi:hypothetical protein
LSAGEQLSFICPAQLCACSYRLTCGLPNEHARLRRGANTVAPACLALDTAIMEKKPGPTKPILWDIYIAVGVGKVENLGMLVGTIEAASENDAIEKAAPEFKQFGRKLTAVRHN